MSLCVTGRNTSMIKELVKLTGEEPFIWQPILADSLHYSRYVFSHGLLDPCAARNMSPEQMHAHADANWFTQVRFCEQILLANPVARICLIGSESGYKGSYNEIYAGAKAALHHYVETRKLEYKGQQLVAVAPTIIEDSGMTQRRPDYEAVMERGKNLRRGQWIHAKEVAEAVHFLLYRDSGSICNTVLRITGGV